MNWRILNTLDISGAPEAENVLRSVGNLENCRPIREEILENISYYDAYMASAEICIDTEFISNAKKLKVIGSPSTGTDHMDLGAISSAQIKLFHIAQEFDLINSFSATSELGFGLALSVIRKIPQAIQSANNGVWGREKFSGFQLLGKTLGIIGLGRLGKISARIGQGFGMNVIANDIKKVSFPNVKVVELDNLLKLSDIIMIHVHLNNSTENMISEEQFSLMKKSAIVINTSRGKVINEKALLKALQNKTIAGAGLDVVVGEWLNRDELFRHPLINYSRLNDNLVITPHIGGSTVESIYYARVFMAKKIAKFIREYNCDKNKS